jgi:SAM-dependent methyltransferase
MSAAPSFDWAYYDYRQTFSRYLFDPENNIVHESILRQLRRHGHTRRGYFTTRHQTPQYHCKGGSHLSCCASVALQALRPALLRHVRKGGTFADLGCGDSADAAIVAEHKFPAYGVDLFPPGERDVRPEDLTLARFCMADIASLIPFPDGSITYASSQAAVDLIEPEARPTFYAEVFRVVESGGVFILNGCNLVNGYGYRAATEKGLCEASGFKYAEPFKSAMIFKKPRRST